MAVKAKYIKDLPLKENLEGTDSLILQDDEGTKRSTLEVIGDKIAEEANKRVDELEKELVQTNTQLSELANKGTTVEVLERVTKEEIDRQIADGTLANLMIEDNSITSSKIKDKQITSEKLADYVIEANHISDHLFTGGEYCIFTYKPKTSRQDASYLTLGFKNPFLAQTVTIALEMDITHSHTESIGIGRGGLNDITNPNYNKFYGWSTISTIDNVIAGQKTKCKIQFTCPTSSDYPHIAVGLVIPHSNGIEKETKIENIKATVTYNASSSEQKVVCAGIHYANDRFDIHNVRIMLEQDKRFVQGVQNIIKETPLEQGSVRFEHLAKDATTGLVDEIFGKQEPTIIYKPDITSFEKRVIAPTTFIIAQPLPFTGVISSVKFDSDTDVYLTLFTKSDDNYFTPYARHLIEIDEYGNVSLNEPISVSEENTYVGISGAIAFQSGISSTSEINRMYDFKATPVIGNPVQAVKSPLVLWFAMELSMVTTTNPVEIVETRLNAKIKELNKEIENLKYMIGNSGGSSLSDDPVKNLRTVWDLNLNEKIDGWVYSNATPNESGTLCSGMAKAYYNQYLTFDTYQQKSTVVVNDVNSQFGLICHNGVKGALYLVDGVNKRISLHNNYTGGNIPNVKVSTPLPFELKKNGNYLLHVVKTGWKHTFTITDLTTMESCSVEFDNATQPNSGAYCGKGWGGPGVATFSGSVLFKNHRYHVALFPKARVLFIGDSITEGTNMGAGVDIKYRWCSLLRDNYFNHDAIICGRGGATSDDILSRMNSLEVLGVKADIVIVLDGTNERNQNATNNWKVKMPQIRDKIISWGAKPIICVPPIPSSGFEYISQMRDFILEQGWDTIRMDIATSLNGDGVTYDGTLYTDGVHPNRKGGEQMYARAVKDLDVIL